MKGFLFSTEALFAMSIIILTLGIVHYETTQTTTSGQAILFENQNAQLITLYFNIPSSSADASATNQYCSKVEKYSTVTKTFFDTNVCRGIR